jgi:hypothetical protein
MLNLNTEDINSIGNTIGTLIFFIIIIIGILIIIDEIFHISKFCFKYTYLYNYGKLNENICKKDNNNLIEFETSRYRIYNELNNYKFEKDLFNKNWINYIVFVSILLISILMCFAFGYIFYHLFIKNEITCNSNNPEHLSFLNNLLKCIGIETPLPNCSFYYLILLIIIIIYPSIFLLKFLVNVDYSLENNGTFTKIFHFIVFISLLYFIYILIYLKDDTDYFNLTKIGVFISFIIIFYIVNITFNKSYSDYYNINKGTNIYSRDKTIIGFLNKYFHFANDESSYDDFRDTNFFEIYKQEEPIKPKAYEKPPELDTFKYCNEEDFSDSNNKYCNQYQNKKEEYKQIKNKINEYYLNKKQYEKNLNIYNFKYNIYKNNKIDFPDFVAILSHMLPKLLGFHLTNHIILFICLIIFLFYYNYLKTNNKQKEANYIYYTIIIYIISLLSILILSNAVLTYNTYVNKYLIYEPISNYKEDLFNMDVLFNILLNKDTNKTLSNHYISLYNKISSKKLTQFNSQNTPFNLEEEIKKAIKNPITTFPLTINNTDDINKFRCQILRILFSDLLKIDSVFDAKIKEGTIGTINDYNSYFTNTNFNNVSNTLISSTISLYNTDLRTFFIIIKNIFVEDRREFDRHIQKLKNNLKYLIYNDFSNINIYTGSTNLDFYKNYLLNDISNEDLLKIDNTKNNDYIQLYLHNLNYINMIFDYYKIFLEEFRNLIIELFNSTEVICENKENVININTKLNHYISKLFNEKIDFNKDQLKNLTFNTNEPKINIYKKILVIKLEEFNIKYKRYFDIIKLIYLSKFDKIDTTSSNKLEYNIINNYNFFNKDTNKHLSQHLLKYNINITNDDKNRYDNYDSEKLLKLNLSINNISWSFVILMIIIAIFLIEPIIIQS